MTFASALSSGLGTIGNTLFPVDPSIDPQQAQALQRSALIQAGLGTLAGAQQPGATLGGSLFGGFQQGAQSIQQAQQNALASAQQKRATEREDRLAAAQAAQAKLAGDQAAAKTREQTATVAQRIATGVEKAGNDALGYYSVIRNTPEFAQLSAQYQIDPDSITTPQQVKDLGKQLSALGSVGAQTPTAPNVQLRAIVGPDGKPLLVREEDAIGQQAYYQPTRAGLAVTLPDGTEITDGPSVVQPGELTKPTQNKLQETIISASDRLDRLNQTLSTYKPEYLQARGLLKAKTGELAEFLGAELDPEKKDFLSKYSEFTASAASDFNATLKELSGAAVTDGEAKRALQSAPSPNDRSPTQFEAKAKATTKTIRRAILRANYALKNGIGTKSVDQLAKIIPLEAVDAIYEARANEILAELGGGDDKRAEAIQRANQEFGLAR